MPTVLFLTFFLPQFKLAFFLSFPLFTGTGFAFGFYLLLLKLQSLLRLCSNPVVLQMFLNVPLHSLGIDAPFSYW